MIGGERKRRTAFSAYAPDIGLCASFSASQKLFDRRDQQTGRGTVGGEPMVPVERFGSGILGIDHNSKDGDLAPRRPLNGVEQEDGTDLSSPVTFIDGQSTDPRYGQGRVAWDFPGQLGWEFGEGNIRRRQGIEPRHLVCGRIQGHVATCDALADVLRRLRAKVPVQCFAAAPEAGAVVLGESGDAKGWRRHDSPTRRR